MDSDDGLNDQQINKYVAQGVLSETDGIILKKLPGNAQAHYLQAILDLKQSEREHPWL